MIAKIVSPLEFVAIAQKMTPAEKHLSMLVGEGLIHAGELYDVAPAITDDAATAVERTEALRRIRGGAPSPT
jgi:hypothetical protein